MDRAELEELLEEIRLGRQEDTSTDWKLRWYDFKHQAPQNDFVRDITAMANGQTSDRRVIVFGVKLATVQGASLPEDEADLQNRLKRITPTPTVVFKNITLTDGTVLSVAEVHGPFDPPYVARIGDVNHIYVRQGSTTTTATRSLLDRWYRAKEPKAEMALFVDRVAVASGGTYTAVQESVVPPAQPAPADDPTQIAVNEAIWRIDVERAALRNQAECVQLSVLNCGDAPAEHLVADIQVHDVTKLAYDESGLFSGRERMTGARDKTANCYVDMEHFSDESVVHVRQRVRRINPGVREPLVPLWVLTRPSDNGSLRLTVTYDIVEGKGGRVKGSFDMVLEFEGEVTIPRR